MVAALLFMRRMAEISGAKLVTAKHPAIREPLPRGVVLYEIAGPLFFGAAQNALEHTINNLQVASENFSASESRIRDLDVASEMVTFTKTQILQQAGTAILAQANSAPQSVLKLLQ